MKKKLFPALFLFTFLLLFAQTDTKAAGLNLDNSTYTFHTVDGTRVSTKAVSGKTTVLIFGKPSCSRTTTTLTNIAQSSWIGSSDIRVIFAECNLASLDEVKSYAWKFDCDKISFCYDDNYPPNNGIFTAMFNYAMQIQGSSNIMTPFILLIDQNDKIQASMQGSQTADQIKSEIDKFAGNAKPNPPTPSTPSEELTGFENPDYIFSSINGTRVSTRANANQQATVLLFGSTTCGLTRRTLSNIAASSWIHNSNIRVAFGECTYKSKTEVSAFAQQFNCDKIAFCYDEENQSGGIRSAAFKYLSFFQEAPSFTMPLTILIDKNNRVQKSWQGTLEAETLNAAINQLPKPGVSTPTPGAPAPETPVSVANVTGLKAASNTKSIKLSWNKTKGANGYIIYQYSNSKWNQKATVSSAQASYSVTKLQPGSNYRFAVKAYTTKNGKRTLSKSYASLYTATKPTAANFKITAGKKKATLKWNKVKGATGYKVYYKTSKKASWKLLKTTKATSFTKKQLKSKKTYTFTVKAYKTYKGKTYTADYKSKKATIK